MFEICKEYGIEKLNLREKTSHDAMKWYKKRHLAMMDDMPFDGMKPPKDMDERINQLTVMSGKHLSNVVNWASVKTQALK